jgi:hypothetical protein
MAQAELDILPTGNSPAIAIAFRNEQTSRKRGIGLVVGFFAVVAVAVAAINSTSVDEASDIATAIASGDAAAIDIASGDATAIDTASGDATTIDTDPEDMLADYLASQAELMYSADETARYPDDDSAKPYFEHASGLGYKFHILYREQTSKRPDETSYKKYFVLTESAMAFANDANGNQWNWVRIAEDLLNVQWKALGLDAYDLTNKNVVITGASRGIGFDLAVRCAQMGANVYGVARTKNWFEWSKAAAISDGVELTTETSRTGNFAKAKKAWNADWENAASVPESLTFVTSEVTEFLLPMRYSPMYFGEHNVNEEVFDRITFEELDVRSAKKIHAYIKALKSQHGLPNIDVLFLFAATEGNMFDYSTNSYYARVKVRK